jgi:hypothetical protein
VRRIILKIILNRMRRDGKAWAELIWFRTGNSGWGALVNIVMNHWVPLIHWEFE